MNIYVLIMFSVLLAVWFITEIVWHKKDIHRIHSLSRHFILHQSNQYGIILNCILLAIILTFIIFHHHTVCDLIIVLFLFYLFYDFTCGYRLDECLTIQMHRRHHYLISGLFVLFLYVWAIYNKIIPSLFMSAMILINIVFIIYVLSTYNSEDWFGILELSIFILFIVHCLRRKDNRIIESGEQRHQHHPRISERETI